MPILVLLAVCLFGLAPWASAEESVDQDNSPALPVPPPEDDEESQEERMAKAAAADRAYEETMANRQAAIDRDADDLGNSRALQFGLGLLLTLAALAAVGWWYIRTQIPPRRTSNAPTSTTTLRKSRP